MSGRSPVSDDVHLQLCRAWLVLNQQGNGHEQRGYSPIAPANEVRKLEDWMK